MFFGRGCRNVLRKHDQQLVFPPSLLLSAKVAGVEAATMLNWAYWKAARRDAVFLMVEGENMSGQSDHIEHLLDINEVGILETLVRKEVTRQIKERPECINAPDWIDEALHTLLEKLARCYRGI